MKVPRFNLNQCAIMFGTDRNTLSRALKRIEIDVDQGSTYLVEECFRALTSDYKVEKAKLTAAQRREQEVKARIAEESVIPKDKVQAFMVGRFAQIRETIVAMPGQWAAQLNPSDPTHARAVLERMRDQWLKQWKEHRP